MSHMIDHEFTGRVLRENPSSGKLVVLLRVPPQHLREIGDPVK